MIRLQIGHRTYMYSVEIERIETTLGKADEAISERRPLGPTGFWAAVSAVKKDPALVEQFADRIGRMDRAAFKEWALMVIPIWLGTVVSVGMALIGIVLVGWAYRLDGWAAAIVFLLGFGVVLVSTHGLAHLFVGVGLGMRFTHWFVASWKAPQPGVKLDYATYLRADPRDRAWMHAAGAVVTKILPFAFIPAAVAADVPGWVVWLLALVGLAQLVTDFLWSTKASDWKKFSREYELARSQSLS
jgi:hypothetical protein